MRNEEKLVEAHVMEYESRLKHIDELIERSDKAKKLAAEHQAELSELKRERENLASNLEEIGKLSAQEWAKKGGPMVVWDIVAERLERLVEHLE